MARQEPKEKANPPSKRGMPKILERGNGKGRGRGIMTPEGIAEASIEQRSTRHEVQGILFGALAVFLLVSLLSYHYYADDPISLPGAATIKNVAGIVGAVISHTLFQYFGFIAYLFPLLAFLLCLDRFQQAPLFLNAGNGIATFIAIVSLCALFGLPFLGTVYAPGGILGAAIATMLKSYFKLFGSVMVIMTGLLIAGLLLKKSFFPAISGEQPEEDASLPTPRIFRPQNSTTSQPPAKRSSKPFSERIPGPFKKKPTTPPPPKSDPVEEIPEMTGYHLPPTTLLNTPQMSKTRAGAEQSLLKNSKILEDKLLDFGIEGQVVAVLPGPVITRYEFQPAPGIKVSRIVNLSDDLALAMKAISVRIVAPVPGKDVVGIEVPNDAREMVYLREILEANTFIEHPSKLALGIGKDISGKPYVADLTKMPHLLIAGATGSGKSVCLNALISSILFHSTPEEVRFIMIDPKMLELGVYDDIPHLLIPVVKNPQHATNALNWATEEMTRRYGVLAQKGVRNIAQFNDAILEFRKTQHIDPTHPVDAADDVLPYIVVIVDELADLMMVAAGVEKPIARLAQMARAVGIHLILATQRPSVDVITGIIKANFPARIAFRVSSKVDSRTILDANGAEVLLGDGDMLFLLPGTSHLTRLHGAYLSEKEIKRLTTTLKKMAQPHYDQAVLEYSESVDTGEADDEQELYEKAVRLVVTHGEASVSMLRRVLKLGHSRASRFIDIMEKDGIVGDFNGSRPRDILVKPEELNERFQGKRKR